MNSKERSELKREKLIGTKYSRLTIIGFEYVEKRKRYYAKCICDCGNEIIADQNKLKTGHTKSCGCLNKDILEYRNKHILSKHNLSNHPFEATWRNQKRRCEKEDDKDYVNYGGIGIKCVWTLEEACRWYDLNPKPKEGYTLDRIDPNGNYEESNVRWASIYTQAINKHNYEDWSNVYEMKNGKYKVSMSINGKVNTKTLETEEEAISYKLYLKQLRENIYFND